MDNIYLVNISDSFPDFYVFSSSQQSVVGAVNVYLTEQGYTTVPTSEEWSVTLVNTAYMSDDSIILTASN